MGLLQDAADGPTHPGAVTIQEQQYLPEAAVARILLSRWANKASVLETTDRRLSSEFMGGAQPIGDQIRVPRRDRHDVTKGINFNAQPRQTSWVDVHLFEPRGIHSQENMWVTPLYTDSKTEKMRYEDKLDRFVDEIEMSIAEEMAKSYWYGVQPLNVAQGTVTLAAAGRTSTTHPGGRIFLDTLADLEQRGINGRRYCALLDPYTNASLTEAIQNVPYSNLMSSQAFGKGRITGNGRYGWDFKRAVHNGTINYTNTDAAMQANATPAQGATAVTIRAPAGKGVTTDHKLEFDKSLGVNEATSEEVLTRASWAVTAGATAGATKAVTVDHPFNSDVAQSVDKRRRTCSARPAPNAKVFINGVDTSVAANRSALADAVCARSFLIAVDTTMLVMTDPDLPMNRADNEQAIKIKDKDYGVSLFYMRYWEGDNVSHKDRIDGRWGPRTTEPEGGYILGGARRAA